MELLKNCIFILRQLLASHKDLMDTSELDSMQNKIIMFLKTQIEFSDTDLMQEIVKTIRLLLLNKIQIGEKDSQSLIAEFGLEELFKTEDF